MTIAYDPITRQVQLRDGKPDLDSLVDAMEQDGVIDSGATGQVDHGAGRAERWS